MRKEIAKIKLNNNIFYGTIKNVKKVYLLKTELENETHKKMLIMINVEEEYKKLKDEFSISGELDYNHSIISKGL